MDVVILIIIINHSFFITLKYILHMTDKGRQLRVQSWTCFDRLSMDMTKDFDISLSAMFLLSICLFRGGGGGCLLLVLSVFWSAHLNGVSSFT